VSLASPHRISISMVWLKASGPRYHTYIGLLWFACVCTEFHNWNRAITVRNYLAIWLLFAGYCDNEILKKCLVLIWDITTLLWFLGNVGFCCQLFFKNLAFWTDSSSFNRKFSVFKAFFNFYRLKLLGWHTCSLFTSSKEISPYVKLRNYSYELQKLIHEFKNIQP